MAMTMTKAELQDAYDVLKAEHEGFTARLIEVAGEAAAQHELCEVLEETLGTLGIDPGITRVTVTKTTVETFAVPTIHAYRIGILGDESVLGYGSKEEAVNDSLRWGNLSEYRVSDRPDVQDVTGVTVEAVKG